MICSNLKILHIITSLRAGGAERLVIDLLVRLERNGHDVALLVFDGTRTPLFDELENAGIKIHICGVGYWQMWNPAHVFRIRRLLRANSYHIVHTHNTPPQFLTALAGKGKASALITTEHNTFNRRREKRWLNRIDRWMYGKYSRIICVSRQTQINLLESLGNSFWSENICTIPNGVDLSKFNQHNSVESSGEKRDKDTHIVLMVAGFRKQKDQPTLIRAMQCLPANYRLWLVGDGITRKQCERLATSLKLNDRITFWGFRDDIPMLISQSDVIVQSSYYEGLALSVVEGMVQKKVVIASDVDGLREVVDGAGLLFKREDEKELAALIKRVCEDKGVYDEIALRCMERGRSFDIEKTVQGYEKMYENVLFTNKKS